MLKVITSDLKICTPLGERFRNAGVEFELLYLSAPEKQLKDCLAAELGGSADLFVIGESFFVKETVADVLDRQLVYDKKAQIDLIRVPEKEKKLKPPAEFEMEKLLLFPEDFSTFSPRYGYECASMGKYVGGDIILAPDNFDEALYTLDNYVMPYLATKQKFSSVSVYKIFGPGNQYVTAAKQQVSLRDVAIDMPAGPSEVEVLADETANPVFVAADLLSQAEHGVDSQAMLITTSEKLMKEVEYEVQRQLALLPRWEIAEKSLASSKLILVRDMDEAIALTNEYAPEHLIIETRDYMEQAERIVNAGSVFLGSLTPESAGDYASGTNHTLPTNGYAKAYSGVSLDSFIRKITFQEINGEGIQNIGPAIEVMAANEQLGAHKNAVTVRLKTV